MELCVRLVPAGEPPNALRGKLRILFFQEVVDLPPKRSGLAAAGCPAVDLDASGVASIGSAEGHAEFTADVEVGDVRPLDGIGRNAPVHTPTGESG